MVNKPTYEELEQRVKDLENESLKRISLENALRESQERLELALDGADLAMWNWNVETGYVEYGPRWAEILGYSADEIKPHVSAWEQLIHPEDIHEVMQKVNANLDGSTSLYECEHRLKTKSGEWRWVLARGKVVERDSNGKALRHTGTQFDVTDRVIAQKSLKKAREELEQKILERTAELVEANELLKKEIKERKLAEEELKSYTQRLAIHVEQTPLGVIEWDCNFRVTQWNHAAEKIFGYTREEAIGQHGADLIVPDTIRKHVESLFKDLIEKRGGTQSENQNITKDGRQVTCDWYNTTLVNSEGIAIGAASLVMDISHRKQLEAQLQQSQKMESLGTLAGGIAHNFNNILMGILGRVSLILVDKEPYHTDFEQLKGIEEYVQNGAELTKDLLGFARGGKYEVKSTNLNELIKHETRMFGRTKKEISIKEKYDKNLSPVEVDQGQMQQVLMNLYVNAWQAMPKGGDLYVQTENVTLTEDDDKPFEISSGRYVKISVTDTGIGMDNEIKEKIFEPFFTTQPVGEGTGLGLASVYGIVKNHQGYIYVYSEKEKGTTFNIYLPASEKKVINKKKPSGEAVKGEGTILLVDDEEMITVVGEKMLEKLGYKVIVAKNGKQAITLYEKNRADIDMVILDMIMSGMSGGDTYDRLKEIDSDIQVLLSTGYSINGQAQEILDRGCNGFIQKPFNLKELSQKIKETLDKR